MKADILSVGTELLLGEVVDTNAAYLAGQLALLGIDLLRVSVVGDDLILLVEAFRQAMGRSDLIVSTGGLGPTEDDLTREAIAAVLNEPLRVAPEVEDRIRAMFTAMGREMPPGNVKQATLIPSARNIPNPRGTAPGWWVERDCKMIVAMPGPPGEMKRMWEVEVVQEIKRKLQGGVLGRRTVKCFGLSEAEVDQLVSPLFTSGNPVVGIYAKPDGIHARIIARTACREEANAMTEAAERRIRAVLGDRIWGADEDTLEGEVGRLLVQQGLTLATMESCTGGLLGSTLTDVPGSSAYYRGGLIAYSSEAKRALGVDPELLDKFGAVSGEAARAMAEAARRMLCTDVGVGITGVAGPEGLEGKPPGLVYVGVADDSGMQSFEGRYPPRRDEVKNRAVTYALFLLRQRLAGCGLRQ